MKTAGTDAKGAKCPEQPSHHKDNDTRHSAHNKRNKGFDSAF